MRHAIIFGLIILLANCAMTKPSMKPNQNKQYGKSIDLIERQWGPPNQKISLSNGQTVYFYTKTGSRYDKTSISPPVQINVDSAGRPVIIAKPIQNNGLSPAFSCAIMLIVDKKGIIVDSETQGENCYESSF